MDKNELFKVLSSKTFIDENEYNTYYEEKSLELKKKGVLGEDLIKMTLALVKLYYKKQLLSSAQKFEGIIVGDLGVTDYGAQKKFNDMKKIWNEGNDIIREGFIRDGFVDNNGNPLWNTDNFKKGTIINPENEKERRLLLLIKEETQNEYKKAYISLKGAKLNIERPLFESVLFRANKKKEEGNYVYLNQSTITEFKKTNSKVDAIELLKIHFKENLVRNLSSLEEYHNKNQNDRNRLCIVKGNVVNINLDTSFSNIINIEDESLNVDKAVTCFLDKNVNIDFGEGSLDVIFLGRTSSKVNEKGDNVINLNLYSFYCDEKFKINDKKVVKEEEVEENELW